MFHHHRHRRRRQRRHRRRRRSLNLPTSNILGGKTRLFRSIGHCGQKNDTMGKKSQEIENDSKICSALCFADLEQKPLQWQKLALPKFAKM